MVRSQRRHSISNEEALLLDIKEGLADSATSRVNEGTVDVNAIDRKTGISPLHACSVSGDVNIARLLLNHGANPDVPDRSGFTPLHRAAQGGKTQVMELLMYEYAADTEVCDNAGRTALHLASTSGQLEAVKVLISAGAVINSTTPDGYTPLHWACWNGRLEIAILLYENGADLDAQTKYGNSALHKAIEKKRLPVIKWLIVKGANVSAANKGSQYPLDILKHDDRREILNEDKFPLHALMAHRCSLWVQIVLFAAQVGDVTRLQSYLARYPQLAYVKEPSGRLVLDFLDEKNKTKVLALLHWHGRYRLLENLPIASSSDTLILNAVDEESIDDFGNPQRVALKLLTRKDRYRREIDARASNLSAEYVVQVLANYPTYNPEKMHSRIIVNAFSPAREIHASPDMARSRQPSVSHTGRRMSRAPSIKSDSSAAGHDSPELHAAPEVSNVDPMRVLGRTGGGCQLTKEEAEAMFMIVMPLADRDLDVAMKHDVFFAGGAHTVEKCKDVFSQLVRCVAHIHDAGLVHGDIKPLNIVLSGGRWKLIDFDCAVLIGDKSTVSSYSKSSAYMPPECVFHDGETDTVRLTCERGSPSDKVAYTSPAYDCWALGCIFYTLCNRELRPLFRGDQRDQLSTERHAATTMAEDDSLWALHDWTDARKEAKLALIDDDHARSLVASMLHSQPTQRPSMDEIMSHAFFSSVPGSVADAPAYIGRRPSVRSKRQMSPTEKTDMDAKKPPAPTTATSNPGPHAAATNSRVDVHRALASAREGEIDALRAQLEQVKQHEKTLLSEVEQLRTHLGKYVLVELTSQSTKPVHLAEINDIVGD